MQETIEEETKKASQNIEEGGDKGKGKVVEREHNQARNNEYYGLFVSLTHI